MLNRSIARMVAPGLTAAVLATILGYFISPDRPVGAISVLARALAYSGVVFAAAGLAAYRKRIPFAKETAVRTATAALWLPPLLMFSIQRSPFALVLCVVLVVEVARLAAFFKEIQSPRLKPLEASPEVQLFSVLRRDLPYGTSILGAFTMQGAIFAGMAGHLILASVLYATGTGAIAHRTFRLFRDIPASHNASSMERAWGVLSAATFIIVFAWLPFIAFPRSGPGGDSLGGNGGLHYRTTGGGGNGSQGHHGAQKKTSMLAWLQSLLGSANSESHAGSFTVAKRMLDSEFPHDSTGTTRPRNAPNTNIPVTELVTAPVFPGVELYPEVQLQTKLLAPPQLGKSGGGRSSSDPLSIPFDGVYRFWRGPTDGPPLNSVVMHGSPSAQFFRSTDGDGMSMEAKQNLGFVVDPRQYCAIEIDIQNADPFPHSVSILLKIRNTTLPGKPIQSLGMEDVSTPAMSAAGSRQTLRFRVPTALAMGRFDELTVSYYLRGARSNRSARIAIERFRLIPRSG